VRAPRTGETSEDGIREKPFSREPTRAASECPRLLCIVLITAAYPTMGTPPRPNPWKGQMQFAFSRDCCGKPDSYGTLPKRTFMQRGYAVSKWVLRSSVSRCRPFHSGSLRPSG
jgi:hypothetical protein